MGARTVNAHGGLPRGIFMPFCSDEQIESIVPVLQLSAKYAEHLIFLSFLKCCMDAKLIRSCNSKSRGYRINPIITEYVWFLRSILCILSIVAMLINNG